jgi:hypothetical protein
VQIAFPVGFDWEYSFIGLDLEDGGALRNLGSIRNQPAYQGHFLDCLPELRNKQLFSH